MADLKTVTDKAEAEARRAEDERTKDVAEKEKARCAEERATSMDGELKLAKAENVKLMAKLEEAKKAQERTEADATKAFDAGKLQAKKLYADEALKFEYRGFKHGWLKALVAAKVTLDMLILYEQLEVKPLESDQEDFEDV